MGLAIPTGTRRCYPSHPCGSQSPPPWRTLSKPKRIIRAVVVVPERCPFYVVVERVFDGSRRSEDRLRINQELIGVRIGVVPAPRAIAVSAGGPVVSGVTV